MRETTVPLGATRVLIVYYSRFGALKAMAEQIGEGARRVADTEVHMLDVGDDPLEQPRPVEDADAMQLRRGTVIGQLAAADALIVGGPSYFGSMASPLKRFFEDCATAANPPITDRSRPWKHYLFRDKVGAAFTASATPHGGNEQTLHSILTMLMHLGMVVVTPGQREPVLEDISAPYGPTLVTGPKGTITPASHERAEAARLGERVALLTRWLMTGREAWESVHGVGATEA